MKIRVSILIILLFLLVSVSWVAAAQSMRPHHESQGLSCDDCHTVAPAEAVPMEQCLTCHELPEVKNDYNGAADKHDSPHYGPELECENCHHEHVASENFCAQCHEFDFKVP